MRERPILFSAPMVRAILDGRKTQTRRAIRPQPKRLGIYTTGDGSRQVDWCLVDKYGDPTDSEIRCPYGQPGDRLWVREEHYRFGHWEPIPGVRTKTGRMKWRFVADSDELFYEAPPSYRGGRHHKDPSTPAWHKRLARFMPRRASRLLLDVTDVRVERLHAITEEDARAEGAESDAEMYRRNGHLLTGCDPARGLPSRLRSARDEFRSIWTRINGPASWAENPWVWVVGFEIAAESGAQVRVA